MPRQSRRPIPEGQSEHRRAAGWRPCGGRRHASYDEYVYELTVPDQPLNIAMESLLGQESLELPMAVLGQQEGRETNRAAG